MGLLEAASEPRVAFQDFPAEIIEKVFHYCLPDEALDKKQNNARIAPMLLCHVCSQWRSIALQSPRLWMCLFHIVRIPSYMKEESGLLKKGIHPTNLEFLEWWWCNLGANHPFHWRFHVKFEGSYFNPEDRMPVQEHLLTTLFNLAQHLDIDQNVAAMFHGSTITFPNLKSLRIRHNPNTMLHPPKLFPVHTEHPIRKLHMQRFTLKDPDVSELPILSWSSLTHVVFTDVALKTSSWFDLIRACVNLQFGYFGVRVDRSSGEPQSANPLHFTHHHLRQLVVAWDEKNDGQYMLKNLLLPSLTALRISAQLTTEELHRILESTPSLVELHLGHKVAPNTIWYLPDSYFGDRLPEPLSKYAPNLQHLVIQFGFYVHSDDPMTDYIEGLLTSSWLQLGEPTNAIRSLEIRALYGWVHDLRRELDDRLAVNPIQGLKASVVNNDKPLFWTSSTSLEKSEAKYFEEPNFGRGPGFRARVSHAYSEGE